MREPIVNIAVKAARAAGNIIVRAQDRLDTIKITEKQPNDYVTDIDQQVEQEIIKIIRKAHPNHGIIGEECGELAGKNDEYTWIIDPIDGTRNFIHGLPHFAVSIGIMRKGKVEHGVIYDPARQELFSASKGKGARLNDHRIRVSNCSKLEQALLSTGFPAVRTEEDIATTMKSLQKILEVCSDIRRAGAATLDLAYVAAGRLDGYWEYGLKPWDLAAGTLMIKEAGGFVCDIDSSENFLHSGNVIAGTPKIVKAILKAVWK